MIDWVSLAMAVAHSSSYMSVRATALINAICLRASVKQLTNNPGGADGVTAYGYDASINVMRAILTAVKVKLTA